MRPGDKVRLVTPDNPRLNGAQGVIRTITVYGAIISTKAAGSGEFRALFEEIVEDGMNGAGYTGDICSNCGSIRVRRAGSCGCCDDCGTTTGCG